MKHSRGRGNRADRVILVIRGVSIVINNDTGLGLNTKYGKWSLEKLENTRNKKQSFEINKMNNTIKVFKVIHNVGVR